MKRFYLFCTLILFQVGLFAAETQFSLTTSPKSFSLVSVISDNSCSYSINLTKPKDALVLKMPPTLSVCTQDWYLGELKKSGLLSYIISPTIKAFNAYDTKPFQKVVTPSLSPDLAGLAKSFKHFDFAVFSPVFSPTSPSGFYFDFNLPHIYAGALFTNNHEEAVQDLQVNWNELEETGKNLTLICGFNDSYSGKNLGFECSAFNQIQLKENYGLIGILGYNLKVKCNDSSAELFRRISNISSDIPIENIGYNIKFENITLGYTFNNYCKPSYGGTNQKKSAEFYVGIDFEHFDFSCSSQVVGDIDTGKTATTTYEFNYDKEEINLGLKLGLNRPREANLYANKLDIDLKINDVKFCVDGAKYSVLIGWNDDIEIAKKLVNVKFTVSQNHEYTVLFTCKS